MTDHLMDISFPEVEGVGIEERIRDLCGDLEDYGGGTWLGSTPWQRDIEYFIAEDLAVDLDKRVENIEKLFDELVPEALRDRCSVDYQEDFDDEDDPDDGPPDMSGPNNPTGEGR